MSYIKELYDNYFAKLVACLPMDDAVFIANLYGNQLLPGDINSTLKSKSSQAEKALYFLSQVIKPALDINETSSFAKLLTIMKECGYGHVQTLSQKINDDIDVDKKGCKLGV